MSERIRVGVRTPSEFGFFISQPGKDVTSCTDEELMLSSKFKSFQITQKGIVILPAGQNYVDVPVVWPGYEPLVFVTSSDLGVSYELGYWFTSNTNLRIHFARYNSSIPEVKSGPLNDVTVEYSLFRIKAEPLGSVQ